MQIVNIDQGVIHIIIGPIYYCKEQALIVHEELACEQAHLFGVSCEYLGSGAGICEDWGREK